MRGRQNILGRDIVFETNALDDGRRQWSKIGLVREGRERGANQGLAGIERAGRVGSERDNSACEGVLREQGINTRNTGAADFIDLGVVEDQAQIEVVVVIVRQLHAGAPAIAIIEHVLFDTNKWCAEIVRVVVDVSIALRAEYRGANSCIVGEPDVAGCRNALQVKITSRQFDECIGRVRVGRNGTNVNGAGRRVLAEQRALRATQYFRRIHIDEFVDHRALARTVNTIHVETYRRFDTEVVRCAADAANRKVGCRGCLAAADNQAGNVLLQVEYILDAGCFDLCASNSGYRHRDVHDVLFAFLCDDDDFFQKRLIVLCNCRCGQGEADQRQCDSTTEIEYVGTNGFHFSPLSWDLAYYHRQG